MNDQYSNPYAAAPDDVSGMPRMKPSGITAVGVIAIMLCALGALGGLMQLAAPLMGNFMAGIQQSVIDQAEANPDNQELQMQAEFQKKSMEMQNKYTTSNMVIGGIMTLACLAVLISAIMTMTGSASGRALFATMCLIILVCDLGKAAMTIVQQRAMIGMAGDAMDGALDAQPGMDGAEAEQVKGIAGGAMKALSIAGMVFTIGWFLLKAFFWIYSWRYLNRTEVKSWFEPLTAGVV